MFERMRVDTFEQTGVPVELMLADGSQLKGRMLTGTGRSFIEILNAPGGFIEFEPYGGERSFIAKTTLVSVKLVNVPKPQNLAARQRDLDAFDPHGILGVPATATIDDVKTAWHKLAKIYHPDRYSNAELPTEVRDYLAAMARRINAAYAALEASLPSPRKPASQRTAPIYTSATRS